MQQYNIFCGGINAPQKPLEGETIHLNVQGQKKNVELKIEAISKAMMGNIPDELFDLLEIAAYVYCADQQIDRGSLYLTNYGESWRRNLSFTIPVRKPDLWNSPTLLDALQKTLGFLAGETYSFTFLKATQPFIEKQTYFEFTSNGMEPDEIALFSGGLDSYAGAVDGIVGKGKKMALVGHHSANQIKNVQNTLVQEFIDRGYKEKAQYISVAVRNSGIEPKEYTQRTRSFLFACLAASIAHMFGKDRFSFYENGVVSLNLPLTKDILESRATRTTHPRVINGFKDIFSLVLNKQIHIDHPFQWLTKKEVTQVISQHGFESLIDKTNSCAHPRSRLTKDKDHCGSCSQCIDRRFAILAAGLEKHDSPIKYKIDLLIGDRSMDADIVMAASYVKFAQQFLSLRKEQFITEHPQITSALSEFENLSTEMAEERIFELYSRHCQDIISVLNKGFDLYRDRLMASTLPSGCLLAVSFNRNKVDAAPKSGYDEELKATLTKLSSKRCQFFADKGRIVFKGGYEITGANYDLIAALLDNFRQGKKDKGGDIPYIPTPDLTTKLGIDEPTLCRRVLRTRNELTQRLGVEQGMVLGTNDFIENSQRQGYRLGKELKEVNALVDLED